MNVHVYSYLASMKVLTTECGVWKGPTSTFYSYPSDTLVCANGTHVRKSSRERVYSLKIVMQPTHAAPIDQMKVDSLPQSS